MVGFDGINQRPDDIYALSEQLLNGQPDRHLSGGTEVLGTPILVLADVFSPKYMPGA